MTFTAIINTPGYLPDSDDVPVFDTPGEAWAYLADERREAEDAFTFARDYSDTVNTLDAYATANHGEDVVYGPTPGYDGDHDLGIAYSVQETHSGEINESGIL